MARATGSPGRQPVLKAKVQRWLAQCGEVVAFTQASGHEGGAGSADRAAGSAALIADRRP
jgi:DNA-nicking Smr family endonuclease